MGRSTTIIHACLWGALLMGLFPTQLRALDRGQRIFLRVLGTSDSQKTILVNRGKENGLELGDHAKFSTPQDGYFARAVVVRLSPSRSVWSIYRFVKKDVLKENLVVTAKIATPVKLTEDETRELGLLADSYENRGETVADTSDVDPEQENQLKDHRVRRVSRSASHKGVDFSALEEKSPPERREGIDWSGVDEAQPVERPDNVDFSSLNESSRGF